MYNQLLRHSALHQYEPHGVLIESAIYRAMLDWKANRTQLKVVDLSAEFNVHVFDVTSPVLLSLSEPSSDASAGPIQLKSIRLNDRLLDPATYHWQPDRRTLSLLVNQPGKHRIKLAWQPRLTKGDQSTGFDIDVAPLSCATVELTLPSDAPTVSIPSSRGRIVSDESSGRLTADLGPSTQWSVRWPNDAVPRSQRRIEIDQLLLLDVQPGAVRLTDRIKFRVVEGVARQIVLQVDPRLRLLPFDADSPVKSARIHSGEPSLVVLELADPTQKRGVIDVNFLMKGTHGVGKLRLPHIGQQTSRHTRRWLGVVVDPALQVDVSAVEGVDPISLAEFRGLWGSPFEHPPKLAFRLSPEEVDWSMSSRRVKPQTLVDQMLVLRFDRFKLRYDFQADLTITSGLALRYRVALPQDIEVDHVTFKNADGAELVTHWRHHNDSLTLFLREPTTGSNQLTIAAHRTIGATGRMPLAAFVVENAETRQRRFRLYRGESALLSVDNITGLSSVLPPQNADPMSDAEAPDEAKSVAKKRAAQEDARLIADFVAEQPLIAATLNYSPNAPLVDATAVTTMQREDDGTWTARFDYHVKISDGLVDELRFILPPQWKGPPQLDSSATWRLEQVPGQSWRRFIVRFSTPIRGDYRLSFSGQVTRSSELRVPLVKPFGNSAWQHFLVLPTQIDQRPIAWNRRHLTPSTLPNDFKQLAPPTGQSATYLIGDDAEATLESDALPSGISRVLLADIHLKWGHNGHCNGVAIFDLQPADQSFCLLEMPPSLQIVHASIEGVATLLDPRGERTWRIPLVSRHHPQRIQILFQGTLETSDPTGRIELVAPTLQHFPVERTMWTVYGPDDTALSPPLATDDDIRPLAQQLMRIKAMGQLLAAGESSSTETALTWKRAWAHRLHQAVHLLESQTDQSRLADEGEMKQEARLVEKSLLEQGLLIAHPSYVVGRTEKNLSFPHTPQQLRSLAESHTARLLTHSSNQLAFEVPKDQATALRGALREASPAFASVWQITATPPATTTMGRLWHLSQASKHPATRRMFKGPRSTIQIEYPPQRWAALPPHAALATLLVSLSILAGVLLRRPTIADKIVIRPHLLGVLIGLLWWLFLAPSALGWIIVAISLLTSIRLARPTKTPPPSTITRLHLPNE